MKADMHCDEPLEEFEPGNDRLGVEELFKGIHQALLKLAEWNRQIAAFTTFTTFTTVKSIKCAYEKAGMTITH